MTSIAIIGAGMAGLTLTKAMNAKADVTIFDKSRGVGGRMSTRYAGSYEFDHGAQYSTATSDEFADHIKSLNAVQRWNAPVDCLNGARLSGKPRHVGAPRMNSWPKAMMDGLNIRLGQRVSEISLEDNSRWMLMSEAGENLGTFDWIICTAPAPQSAQLMPTEFAHHDRFTEVEMQGCFALMLGFSTPLDMPVQAAKIAESPVGWISVNSSKPDRPDGFSLLIQSSNDWAEMHLEDEKDDVQKALLEAASEFAGQDLSKADHMALHRWRYAATSKPLGQPYILDKTNRLAVCGDWCLGLKIESAFLSANALSKALDAII